MITCAVGYGNGKMGSERCSGGSFGVRCRSSIGKEGRGVRLDDSDGRESCSRKWLSHRSWTEEVGSRSADGLPPRVHIPLLLHEIAYNTPPRRASIPLMQHSDRPAPNGQHESAQKKANKMSDAAPRGAKTTGIRAPPAPPASCKRGSLGAEDAARRRPEEGKKEAKEDPECKRMTRTGAVDWRWTATKGHHPAHTHTSRTTHRFPTPPRLDGTALESTLFSTLFLFFSALFSTLSGTLCHYLYGLP